MANALLLTFADQAGRTATQGPFAEVFLVGETMRGAPGDPPFATHEEHHWCLAGGKRFFRAECPGPLIVRLRRLDGGASSSYGPFDSVSFVDGIAYADRGVFAFVDRSIGDWYCHEDGRHWAVMVLSPA
jgi:hypothetical protein